MNPELNDLRTALDAHQDAGDFHADWSRALATERPWKARATAGSLALLAASVLVWVGWTALPIPEQPNEPEVASAAPGPADVQGAIVVGLGQMVLQDLPKNVEALRVVRPELVSIHPIRTGLYAVHALAEGRTDMVVTLDDGTTSTHTFVVGSEPTGSKGDWADVPVGGALLSEAADVSAVAIVAPDVLGFARVGDRLLLQGLRAGVTDVRIERGDRIEVVSVEVGGASNRRHDTLKRPAARHLQMALGSTLGYPGSIRFPKTVSIVRPDVLAASFEAGNMVLDGVGVGTTDILVAYDDELEVFTVHVE